MEFFFAIIVTKKAVILTQKWQLSDDDFTNGSVSGCLTRVV